MAFAKKVNKNGSTIQKNFGATMHIKINAISAIKKYNQYFPAGLVVSMVYCFGQKYEDEFLLTNICFICFEHLFDVFLSIFAAYKIYL